MRVTRTMAAATMLALITSVCTANLAFPAGAQEFITRPNYATQNGLAKLRAHVLELPSLKILIEKDTDINEPLVLQRLGKSEYYRAGDVNENQCFYKLDRDWTFKSVSAGEVPANLNVKPGNLQANSPPASANSEFKAETAGEAAKIFRDGKLVCQFNAPSIYGPREFVFFNGGRSLLQGTTLIRNLYAPVVEKIPYFYWYKLYGDMRRAVLYGMTKGADNHFCLNRFDINKDKLPTVLIDFGLFSDNYKGRGSRAYADYDLNRLVVPMYKAEPVPIVDLETGRVVSRLVFTEVFQGKSVIPIPSGPRGRVLISNEIVDLISGKVEATLDKGVLGSDRFLPDGKVMISECCVREDHSLRPPLKLVAYDTSAHKVISTATLHCDDMAKNEPIGPCIHQKFFIDDHHLLITTGSRRGYIDHYHVMMP